MPRLTSEATPLSPYRVIWDLLHIVDVPNTIITHDAGSPRDELSPFWKSTTPLSLHRLGQDHAARLRPGTGHGREARAPGQALHQHVGRRGHRHDGHGLRDLRAREHPDHVHPVQQLTPWRWRFKAMEMSRREVRLHRHLRQLRGLRQGARRLRRAHHRALADRARAARTASRPPRRAGRRCSSSSPRRTRCTRRSAIRTEADPTFHSIFALEQGTAPRRCLVRFSRPLGRNNSLRRRTRRTGFRETAAQAHRARCARSCGRRVWRRRARRPRASACRSTCTHRAAKPSRRCLP